MSELTTDLIVQEPSFSDRTYKLSEKKIEGFVDDVQSLKQAIYKELMTDQYEHPIYSFGYGIDWKSLIGEEKSYVRAELRRMIQETLLTDNRINDVDDFEFIFIEDICHCSFTVTSIYGDIRIEAEAVV